MKHSIVITGASSGLGMKLGKKFEEEGHRVLKHNGQKHSDLSSSKQIIELAEEAKNFGVDVLINNAAIKCPGVTLSDYSIDEIQKMLEVNLLAPIKLTYLLLKDLKLVVNINSLVGLEIKPNRSIYSAAKYGLRGFSNSLKMENQKLNVLDVYTSSFSGKDPKKHMKIEIVVDAIYHAFKNRNKELIIDGRHSKEPLIKYIN